MNNPQIVVAVILDSAVGLHQGGQVSAPVFKRIAQQVLEYLHVPHDLPLAPQHQLLLARAKVNDKDLEEGTPDHPGEPLETDEMNGDSPASANPSVAHALPTNSGQTAATYAGNADSEVGDGHVVQAAIRQNEPLPAARSGQEHGQEKNSDSADAAAQPVRGTVVLDVEQGGIEVPSFVGKTLRKAVEAAQDAGLELDAVGSGVAREQSPAAGTHVASGSRITVQFAQ